VNITADNGAEVVLTQENHRVNLRKTDDKWFDIIAPHVFGEYPDCQIFVDTVNLSDYAFKLEQWVHNDGSDEDELREVAFDIDTSYVSEGKIHLVPTEAINDPYRIKLTVTWETGGEPITVVFDQVHRKETPPDPGVTQIYLILSEPTTSVDLETSLPITEFEAYDTENKAVVVIRYEGDGSESINKWKAYVFRSGDPYTGAMEAYSLRGAASYPDSGLLRFAEETSNNDTEPYEYAAMSTYTVNDATEYYLVDLSAKSVETAETNAIMFATPVDGAMISADVPNIIIIMDAMEPEIVKYVFCIFN